MADETQDAGPVLVFQGGSDALRLTEGGRVYLPGDELPRMSNAQRVALQQAGIRLEYRHQEPVLTPDGEPAEMAAAGQVEPPPGGPAVVAAVVDVPKSETQDAPAPKAPGKRG